MMVLKKELADVLVSVCVFSDNFSVFPPLFLVFIQTSR